MHCILSICQRDSHKTGLLPLHQHQHVFAPHPALLAQSDAGQSSSEPLPSALEVSIFYSTLGSESTKSLLWQNFWKAFLFVKSLTLTLVDNDLHLSLQILLASGRSLVLLQSISAQNHHLEVQFCATVSFQFPGKLCCKWLFWELTCSKRSFSSCQTLAVEDGKWNLRNFRSAGIPLWAKCTAPGALHGAVCRCISITTRSFCGRP